MTLSPNEKMLLFLLAILVVIFAGTKLLVNPAMSRLETDRATLTQLQTEQDLARWNLQTAGQMPSRISKALKSANAAASSLFPSMDNSHLNLWFLQLAGRSGLTLTSIGFSSPVALDIRSLSSGGSGGTTQAAGDQQDSPDSISYLLRTYAQNYQGSGASAVSGGSSVVGSSGKYPAALLEKDVTVTLTGSSTGVTGFLDAIRGSGRTARIVSYSSTVPVNGTGTATMTIQCFGAERPDGSDSPAD